MQNYFPTRLNEILSVDFYGSLLASKGDLKYILSTIDAFYKYAVMYPLRRANAKAAMDKLIKEYFLKYGFVVELR